ncbi:MAG: hypothetical protein LBV27_10920, partial [Oscillospiraceae bacterium]|nr:hypothetical protein [Oscillospiraceae bacterium]
KRGSLARAGMRKGLGGKPPRRICGVYASQEIVPVFRARPVFTERRFYSLTLPYHITPEPRQNPACLQPDSNENIFDTNKDAR